MTRRNRLLIGRLKLTVDGGVVTRAVGLDDAGRLTAEVGKPANLPTLKSLLDEYETARRNGAHVATAEYDLVDGHPTRIELDPVRNTIDDEACYAISGYVELP